MAVPGLLTVVFLWQSVGSRAHGLQWLELLHLVVAAHWLWTRGLCSCGAGAELFHSKWALPKSGIKPIAPALASGFLTAEPPGLPVENS